MAAAMWIGSSARSAGSARARATASRPHRAATSAPGREGHPRSDQDADVVVDRSLARGGKTRPRNRLGSRPRRARELVATSVATSILSDAPRSSRSVDAMDALARNGRIGHPPRQVEGLVDRRVLGGSSPLRCTSAKPPPQGCSYQARTAIRAGECSRHTLVAIGAARVPTRAHSPRSRDERPPRRPWWSLRYSRSITASS
jgi:hypothetical protein